MELVRNIQVKLDVSEDDHSVLDETFDQFRHAAQHVADHGWDDNPPQHHEDEEYTSPRDVL